MNSLVHMTINVLQRCVKPGKSNLYVFIHQERSIVNCWNFLMIVDGSIKSYWFAWSYGTSVCFTSNDF